MHQHSEKNTLHYPKLQKITYKNISEFFLNQRVYQK